MRLSTLYMYKQNADSMTRRMNENNNANMKLSAGRSLLRASDDPQRATDAVKYQDELARLEMYKNVRSDARSTLQHEDHILSSLGDLLTKNLTEKIVAAKSDTFSDTDRAALGQEIAGIRANLLDLANTRDGHGRYIFSGFKSDTPAFDKAGNYQGGSEARKQTITDDTRMQVGHLGDAVFGDVLSKLDNAVAELKKNPIDKAALDAALSDAGKSVTAGIERLGITQAELGTHMQQLDSLDLMGDTLIDEAKNKVVTAIGADSETMTSLIMDSKMSEITFNASMLVFQAMQKMNLFS